VALKRERKREELGVCFAKGERISINLWKKREKREGQLTGEKKKGGERKMSSPMWEREEDVPTTSVQKRSRA